MKTKNALGKSKGNYSQDKKHCLDLGIADLILWLIKWIINE